MCTIITVANQKGGVGKTTTAYNLGYALVEQGKNVLLVDFDPQANMTMCFGIDNPDTITPSISELLTMVIDGKEMPSDKYVYIHQKKMCAFDQEVIPSEILAVGGRLDIIPSNISLTLAEVNMRDEMGREHMLSQILELHRSQYDYCIIDTNPSLGLLTVNALAACDKVIVPVSSALWSATGLQALIGNIYKVKQKLNPRIEIMGILLTICDERTKIFKEVKDLIGDTYGSIKIFETTIPQTVKVQESNYSNQSIIEYNPASKAAIAYRNLSKEILM